MLSKKKTAKGLFTPLEIRILKYPFLNSARSKKTKNGAMSNELFPSSYYDVCSSNYRNKKESKRWFCNRALSPGPEINTEIIRTEDDENVQDSTISTSRSDNSHSLQVFNIGYFLKQYHFTLIERFVQGDENYPLLLDVDGFF
ncbi:hypothetical protein NQ317_003098 [Molorchus minor]|uniref:Uncharacterized protein n=1 Tax=Molorchus minor TaxID=1323400 RepID=A0ABQ9IX97_9CUCU|nr:hypothetical protein NQ317_003098 [Molorchus minor]